MDYLKFKYYFSKYLMFGSSKNCLNQKIIFLSFLNVFTLYERLL